MTYDLQDGEVIVRAVQPGERIGSGVVEIPTDVAVEGFPSIPVGAVSALVQPDDNVRFRKGGDADPPEETSGIRIEQWELFPIHGQLEDARFMLSADRLADACTIQVEFYGPSVSPE